MRNSGVWLLPVVAILTTLSLHACASGDDDDDADDDDADDDDTATDDDVADDDTAPTGLTDEQDEECREQVENIEQFCADMLNGDTMPDGPTCGDCDNEIDCAVWACFADFFIEWQSGVGCKTWDNAFKDCRGEHDPCYPTHPDFWWGNPDCL